MSIKITALIPIYNGEQFLFQLWEKLTINMEATDEIIFIDDMSTDGTYKVLNKLATQDSRVRIISNRNKGLSNALKVGLREATNLWIARFDVDDIYPNDRIINQRTLIEKESVAIFSDYEFIGSKNRKLGYVPSAIFSEAIKTSLYSSQRTAHPSALFNKEAVIEAGGYRQHDFPAEDLSLWLRLSRLGIMKSIPSSGLGYFLHKNSVTAKRRKEILIKKDILLKTIGTSQNNILIIKENICEYFERYNGYSYSNERRLLLLKDYLRMYRYNKNNMKLSDLRNPIYSIINYQDTKCLTHLAAQKIRRDIFKAYGL